MIILFIILFIIIFKNDVFSFIQNTLKNSLYTMKLNWIKDLYKNIDYKNIDYKNILILMISGYLFIYSNNYYRVFIIILILMRKHINNSYYLITKFKNEQFYLNKTNF